MRRLDVDLDLIRQLAGVLDETGLTEIEVEANDHRIRIARQAQAAPVVAPVAMPMSAAATPVAASASIAEERVDARHPGAITSPMVGTAYLAAEPGAPAFVSEGDRVQKGDTLLIVEAMKVMNRITAPRAGTVTRVLVANEAPVEFGEVLMIVE